MTGQPADREMAERCGVSKQVVGKRDAGNQILKREW